MNNLILILMASLLMFFFSCNNIHSIKTEKEANVSYIDDIFNKHKSKICTALLGTEICIQRKIYTQFKSFDYFIFQEQIKELASVEEKYKPLLPLVDYSRTLDFEFKDSTSTSFNPNQSLNEVWSITTKVEHNVVFGYFVTPRSADLYELTDFYNVISFMAILNNNGKIENVFIKEVHLN